MRGAVDGCIKPADVAGIGKSRDSTHLSRLTEGAFEKMVATLGHVDVETRVRVLQHHLVPPLLRRGRPVCFHLLQLMLLLEHNTNTNRTARRCRDLRDIVFVQSADPLAASERREISEADMLQQYAK